jgi:Ser/Thr protein kinase RdoA (MazF antagonist)
MPTLDFEQLSVAEQAARLHRLAEQALAAWTGGWRVVRLIKYRENAVFEVANDAGERAVLRLHRHGYHTDASLKSELLWMDALAKAGVSVPILIRADDGETFVKAASPDIPETRQIDMFAWIEGDPLATVADPARLAAIYREVGRLAAAMHRQSTGWTLPEDFERHAWDRDGLIGAKANWGDYRALPALTPAQLTLLDRASALAHAELGALEGQGYGLIHADFVADNLLYGPDGVRVIDFDDCGFGWWMFELATALFFHIGEPHYAAVEAALVAGYRSEAPLSDADWARLPLFLFLRSLTYLGWVASRPETETAREGTSGMVALATRLAEDYLARKAVRSEPEPAAALR